MIGDFEGNTPDLNLPNCLSNFGNYTQFKSIFLTLPDFSFDDSTDYADINVWKQEIQNGNIFPIHNIKEVFNLSDDLLLNLSKSDKNIPISEGKYKWNINFNYDLEFYQKLIQYSEQYFKIIFSDLNDNLIAVLNSDGTVEGFDTDLIKVKKLGFGTSELPSWTQLYIELADATQIYNGIVSAVDFDTSSILSIQVNITDFTLISSTEITLKITDSIYNAEIEGLNQTSFSFLDDTNGALSILDFEDRGNGLYYFKANNDFTSGDANISDSNYYGTGEYEFRTQVTTSDYTTPDLYTLNFKVSEVSGGAAVTGLTQSDFESFVDDLNGTLTISSFTEVGSGYYEIEFNEIVTEGQVTINDTIYYGTSNYTGIPITATATINAVANLVPVYGGIMTLTITDISTGTGITGLTSGDFTINDDDGARTISFFTEIGNGSYRMNVTGGDFTTGNIVVYDGSDLCIKTYDYDGISYYNDLKIIEIPPEQLTLTATILIDTNNAVESGGYRISNNSSGSYTRIIAAMDEVVSSKSYRATINIVELNDGELTLHNSNTPDPGDDTEESFTTPGIKTFDYTTEQYTAIQIHCLYQTADILIKDITIVPLLIPVTIVINHMNNALNGTDRRIAVTITRTDNGDPVTGLAQSAFTINDNAGARSISSFDERNDGLYLLETTDGDITDGDMEIDDGTYSGSESYVFNGVDFWSGCEIYKNDLSNTKTPEDFNGTFTNSNSDIDNNRYRIAHYTSSSYTELEALINGLGNGSYTVTFDIIAIIGTLTVHNDVTSQDFATSGSKTFNYTVTGGVGTANPIFSSSGSDDWNILIDNIKIVHT